LIKIKIPVIMKIKNILFVLALISTQVFAQNSGKPAVLKFAIHTNGAAEKVESIKPICEYLSKKIGIPVEPATPNNELDLIDQFKKNEIHLAVIGAFGYVVAAQDTQAHVKPLVTYGNQNGPNKYKSCIITQPGSKLKSIKDVKKNSSQLTLMFVNPNSTSGHIFPRLFLKGQGFESIEGDFKEIMFGGSHVATMQAIKDKRADIGTVSYNTLQLEIEQKRLKNGDVKVIWTSQDILVGPIAINDRLDAGLRKQISDALVNMNTESPETWQKVLTSSAGAATGSTGFVVAKDSDYNSVRKSTASIEDLIFIMNFYNN
jgi:phosphonate transport system substrate-binding protein